MRLHCPSSTIHEVFQKQATLFENSVALEYEGDFILYSELQEKINRRANWLQLYGVLPNHIVAVSLERSPEFIITILAVLQCGAAYLPIDSTFPSSRTSFMVDDSRAEFYITSKANQEVSISCTTILLEDIKKSERDLEVIPLNLSISLDAIAYVIYTSGSTGKPKGVKVTHANTINLLTSLAIEPGINENDKIFAHTTISFDAMIMEIFLPLLHGSCIVIVDEETKLDGNLLLKKAIKDKVTIMFGTPSIWQILLDSGWEKPLNLKALIGGESLPLSLAQNLLQRCKELWNLYGPTEATVCCLLTKITKENTAITIGKPIANSHIYIVDERGIPVSQGEIGEIVIGGDGVSLGYLYRPELTAARFIPDSSSEKEEATMYMSGDLGRLLPNGEIQYLGRKDDQVKIRGNRIELGEIETALNKVPGIKIASVIVYEKHNDSSLVAYLQSTNSGKDPKIIQEHLAGFLPDYMIPSYFIWLEQFPIATSGKIDKRNLPVPEFTRPTSLPALKKPRTQLEKDLLKIWEEQLQISYLGVEDNFFSMGGTSIMVQRLVTKIKNRLNIEIPVTKIYQFPSISELSLHINLNSDSEESEELDKETNSNVSRDIAIIGMSGRFPGASSIQELWTILKEGKETITFFDPEELDSSIPEELRNDPLYVKARGIIPSAKKFDASFFGLNAKVATAMDPQQRLFLEVAWEALEQAGHLPTHFKGSIGVYAGTGTNTYYRNNLLPNRELLDMVGHVQVDTLNEKDYIATRTAYHLNLKGPAVSVHSACSTSLLAVSEAVEAIRNGYCDVALAGGSSVTAPINSGHLYQEGSMLSSNGHCRSFDAEGKGTVFSDGAGVVLLKSLSEARKNGDLIYGVIKGVGVNNDGGSKGSFTAPSIEGQAGCIKMAFKDAQISPSSISYIEAHGTATPLGDPIEVEGLKLAFGKQNKKSYCAIGSIKSNMGHLTAAAGVAGLIKTVLAMHHQQIPPSLGYSVPNPNINFKNSPFYVNDKLREWNVEGPRRAGVSSFGVGGTNVHLILEEYKSNPKPSTSERPWQIMAWSAKSEESLEAYEIALKKYLKDKKSYKTLADVAYTLNVTRDMFNHRSFIIYNNAGTSELDFNLDSPKTSKHSKLDIVSDEMVFLFPGQGSQYLQMGRKFYEQEHVFRRAVDACATLLMDILELDIKQILFPNPDTHESTEAEIRLQDTQFTQPALFVIEYALSQLWMSWGIKPTTLCGHSIGEFVAAHLAGVFNLKDALGLVAIRGRLVSKLPGGSMLSVRLGSEEVEKMLPEELSIAASNSDLLCVVSGPEKVVVSFSETLSEQNVLHKTLATSHAFHSEMMNPVIGLFEEEVKKIELNPPKIQIISTVTGKVLSNEEATSSQYWANHLRLPVRYSEAVNTILNLENPVLLEVGPGRSLITLAKQKKNAKHVTTLTSLRAPTEDKDDYHIILNSLGELWSKGFEPDWHSFYAQQSRQKVWLPSYVFNRKLCWVNPPDQLSTGKLTTNSSTKMEVIDDGKNENITMRKPVIIQKISEIILNSSGIELEPEAFERSFLELGLDSLILTQMALILKKEFNMPISFRQLNEEFGTPDSLANYLDNNLPLEMFSTETKHSSIQPVEVTDHQRATKSISNLSQNQDTSLEIIAQQIKLLGKHIELLQENRSVALVAKEPATNTSNFKESANLLSSALTAEEKKEHAKPFGASPRIEKHNTNLDKRKQEFLEKLVQRYSEKTAKSKEYTQKYRAKMADPRVVSGFKPSTKELVYPLVVEKSSGNRLWDLDGNEYMDVLNGFGSCIFGHQPEFITDALQEQIKKGYEIGPQHPLAGEVCELLCEFTNHDRAAICNTGSEAVLGAMRIARTSTGRSLIVAFSGAYHGINDEAIVRGSAKMKTFPAAAGIQSEAVQNMLILEYGTEDTLKILRERANELAAVLVEPVQSRRPEFQPVEFLKEVREITTASKTVLIFDEIITGFRMHPGGAQELFGIKADLATYGKVIGGGMPIGAIVGKRMYMDALDGGFWQYGDNSYPEVGVTYFAGTFVRHPLALSAAKASLLHMKEKGGDFQRKLSLMCDKFASNLNHEFKDRKLPFEITHFGSLWRIKFYEDIPYSELLFVLLREKGIHVWEGFPCFMTSAFKDEDIQNLTHTFLDCVEELTKADFLPSSNSSKNSETMNPSSISLNKPPVLGARLGRDENGNPAWFVEQKGENGGYLKIDL